jgi:hypothetical protein
MDVKKAAVIGLIALTVLTFAAPAADLSGTTII